MDGPPFYIGSEVGVMPIFPYGETEIRYLKSRDPVLGKAIDRFGPIERRVIPDLFAALVNSIAGQQISSKAQETVWKRLQEKFDGVTVEAIHAASLEEIQSCGLSMRKAGYIWKAADRIVGGELSLVALKSLPDDEVCRQLVKLEGVGIWTAEMLLIFSMERPDVLSFGDSAIRKGMALLYGLPAIDRPTFDRYRALYSPYGTVASLYIWAVANNPVSE